MTSFRIIHARPSFLKANSFDRQARWTDGTIAHIFLLLFRMCHALSGFPSCHSRLQNYGNVKFLFALIAAMQDRQSVLFLLVTIVAVPFQKASAAVMKSTAVLKDTFVQMKTNVYDEGRLELAK